MLVSKWTRLWTSSCHLMASRLETRLSKGYWWVRLLRCPARTIGSTNYYVSCVHSWADPHPHYFSLLILFLNYAERVIIVIRCTPQKNGFDFSYRNDNFISLNKNKTMIYKKKIGFFPIIIIIFYFQLKDYWTFWDKSFHPNTRSRSRCPLGFLRWSVNSVSCAVASCDWSPTTGPCSARSTQTSSTRSYRNTWLIFLQGNQWWGHKEVMVS